MSGVWVGAVCVISKGCVDRDSMVLPAFPVCHKRLEHQQSNINLHGVPSPPPELGHESSLVPPAQASFHFDFTFATSTCRLSKP